MKHADIIQLPLLVKDILTENSDSSHLVTMSEIRAILLDSGIEADRRSVYKAINVLNEHGYEVFYEARGGKQGYWIRHPLTLAEALFICDSIQTSSALSEETASSFSSKVASLLSVHEQDKLPDTISSLARTENDHVLRLIEILLNAIADRNPVEFRYYDIGVTKKKQYRKQNKIYHLVPYAIISHNGRYYCVFYSESHHSFANYRIDKMDMVKVLDEQADPVFFSLNDHVRASFNMYHGEPETVTVDFDLNLANVVFDEFGKNIIISKVSADRFTANIRTAVTPTLISWLLQFYDRMEVKKPQSLIDRLNQIADTIHSVYQREEE